MRVMDFSTHFSGAVATRILAHLGADVVKVENPRTGDGNRGMEPLIAGEAMLHLALNSGKRSITIDRRSEDWDALVAACVRWADVVVVGGQPEAIAARGLDHASAAGHNDRVVHCLITGYGEVGPWKDQPSHGLNTDVLAGLVGVEWVDGRPRVRSDYRSVGTTLAGVHAAVGILDGLRRRDAGQGPQRVSVSVWESAMAWSWRDLTTLANLDQPMVAYDDLGSRYALYATSDERVILVCPIERRFWTAFVDCAGLPPEWKDKGDWSRNGMDFGKGYDDEPPVIAARMRTRTMQEWSERLEVAQVPFSPFLSVGEAVASEHAAAVGVLASTRMDGKRVRIPNVPIHVLPAGQPLTPTGPEEVPPPPGLGADNPTFKAALTGQDGAGSPSGVQEGGAR